MNLLKMLNPKDRWRANRGKSAAAICIAALIVGGILPFASAQKATELYIPIGRSPGLSAKLTVIGKIDDVNFQNQTLTVRRASDTYIVHTTKYTLFFLDKSKLRQLNMVGTFFDSKKGMLVEVRFEAGKRDRPAEWIKLQVDQ